MERITIREDVDKGYGERRCRLKERKNREEITRRGTMAGNGKEGDEQHE